MQHCLWLDRHWNLQQSEQLKPQVCKGHQLKYSSISISLFKLQNTLGVIQHPGIDIYLKEADGSIVALTKAAL
jgi:hypothetical protein